MYVLCLKYEWEKEKTRRKYRKGLIKGCIWRAGLNNGEFLLYFPTSSKINRKYVMFIIRKKCLCNYIVYHLKYFHFQIRIKLKLEGDSLTFHNSHFLMGPRKPQSCGGFHYYRHKPLGTCLPKLSCSWWISNGPEIYLTESFQPFVPGLFFWQGSLFCFIINFQISETHPVNLPFPLSMVLNLNKLPHFFQQEWHNAQVINSVVSPGCLWQH